MWRKEGALIIFVWSILEVFPLPLYFPLFISVMGSCLLRGVGAQLAGCQVLPAMGAGLFLELAANRGTGPGGLRDPACT